MTRLALFALGGALGLLSSHCTGSTAAGSDTQAPLPGIDGADTGPAAVGDSAGSGELAGDGHGASEAGSIDSGPARGADAPARDPLDGGTQDTGGRACPVGAPAPGQVATDRGLVGGVTAGGIASFKGIPYAAPPVGELRWSVPADASCWAGVLSATTFGPPCLQKDFKQGQTAASAELIGTEDCLTLNVWAPAAAAPRPVLVYIHGGGNVAGSASQEVLGVDLFDGASLAEQDVVVVTLQYRLGPLGFLVLPELVGPESGAGNLGLLDQIAALHWVRRNIAAFGGDPENVMIFGESAGAVDVCALVASPLAAGLFHRALLQSGGCAAGTLAERMAHGESYAAAVGCNGEDRLACLSALSDAELLAPLKHPFTAGLAGQGGFGPTIDGWVLTANPLEVITAGAHNTVPLVLGANEDETKASVVPGSISPAMVEQTLGAFPSPIREQLLALYPPGTTNAEATESWIRATTDAQFICAVRRVARVVRETQDAPVWRYHFTHTAPPTFGGEKGAFHGLELFYVFGAVERLVGGKVATADDKAVAALMQGAWARFARTGDPNGPGLPAWPAYDVSTDPALEISATPGALEGVHSTACDVWDGVAATL